MSAVSFLRRLLGARQPGAEHGAKGLVTLCDALLAERGEYASIALARDALGAYQALDEGARGEFFGLLASRYSPAPEAVARAAATYQRDPSPENLLALQQTVEPARQELFRRLNMAPGGTATLVAMRAALLRGMRAQPQWRVIDADLIHLLRSWFNRGFLRLQRIDWRTPAIVLEKFIEYEAVHAIQGWGDLRRRLEADRRCFAFFHPQLPDEPIIFIEVALTRGMSAHVQPLLDVEAPLGATEGADCAMFYSITNCQDGLRGISFGNMLIKQVVDELRREFPQLRRFATLSPVPGFRRWLEGAADPELLARIAVRGWHLEEVPDAQRKQLMRLCAYYLLHAKRGDEPLDPVARFHLSNGASLERINWLGDASEQGMARSAGLMVNYVYAAAELERNHERYFAEHAVVAAPAVEKLAREAVLRAEGEAA